MRNAPKVVIVVLLVVIGLMMMDIAESGQKPTSHNKLEPMASTSLTKVGEHVLPIIETLPPAVNLPKKRRDDDDESSGSKTEVSTPPKSFAVQQFVVNEVKSCSKPGNPLADTSWQMRCPPTTAMQRSDTDTEQDRQSGWIEKKYTYYASRCNKTNGMMWKKLSRGAHDKIATKVMDLLEIREENTPIRVFDWACGCGVSLNFLKEKLGQRFEGLGLDLIGGAVAYANQSFAQPGLLFCQGDGTQLSWLPPRSFNFVTSFGGLLHLPSEFMCSTVQSLLNSLQVGGKMWAGYIDSKETASMLMKCNVECEPGVTIIVRSINENKWLKNVGIPAANRKRNPVSIFWEKVAL